MGAPLWSSTNPVYGAAQCDEVTIDQPRHHICEAINVSALPSTVMLRHQHQCQAIIIDANTGLSSAVVRDSHLSSRMPNSYLILFFFTNASWMQTVSEGEAEPWWEKTLGGAVAWGWQKCGYWTLGGQLQRFVWTVMKDVVHSQEPFSTRDA